MLVLIVFVPIIIGGAATVALLLGAATAGAWEAIEERPEVRPPAAALARSRVAANEGPHARAA